MDRSNAKQRPVHLLLLGAVLVYATAFRLAVIDRTFEYDAEGTGCAFGVLARNYLNTPWSETLGMPVLTVGRGDGTPIAFCRDHPPLVPLTIMPCYALFGFGEWQTRLPTALVTLAATVVIYLLLARRATPRLALLAAASYAAVPMNLYYGGMPEVVGPMLCLFALLTIWAYIRFLETPGLRSLGWLVGAFALAGFTDWPAFFLVPVLTGHFLATRPRRNWRWIDAFGVAGVGWFALVLGYITVATHAPWNWILHPLTARTAIGGTDEFSVATWIARALEFNLARHTAPLLLLALAWIVTSGWRVRRRDQAATIARLLLAWGAVHVLVGRQGVFAHEWWWFPLTPGIVFAAALAIDAVLAFAAQRNRARLAGVLAAAFVVIFAGATTRATLTEFRDASAGNLSVRDLGEAIRAAAPGRNDIAMLVHGGPDPQLWFYGNRPLRIDVWTIADFEARVRGDTVDLMLHYDQPWKGAARGIVFPLVYAKDCAPLLRFLEERYAQVALRDGLAEAYRVYDLRKPLRR